MVVALLGAVLGALATAVVALALWLHEQGEQTRRVTGMLASSLDDMETTLGALRDSVADLEQEVADLMCGLQEIESSPVLQSLLGEPTRE